MHNRMSNLNQKCKQLAETPHMSQWKYKLMYNKPRGLAFCRNAKVWKQIVVFDSEFVALRYTELWMQITALRESNFSMCPQFSQWPIPRQDRVPWSATSYRWCQTSVFCRRARVLSSVPSRSFYLGRMSTNNSRIRTTTSPTVKLGIPSPGKDVYEQLSDKDDYFTYCQVRHPFSR